MQLCFITLFSWFHRYPWVRRLLLLGSILVMSWMALSLRFTADLSQFIGGVHRDGDGEEQGLSIFEHTDLKDRLVFMLTGVDSLTSHVDLLDAADSLVNSLEMLRLEGSLKRVLASFDDGVIDQNVTSLYRQLPFFLSDSVLDTLSVSLASSDYVEQMVQECAQTLSFPMALSPLAGVIASDPLRLGLPYLRYFQTLNDTARFSLHDGYIFTKDLRVLLLFAQPAEGMGALRESEYLTDRVERMIESIEAEWPVRVLCFGSPIVSAYNAKRVTADTILTVLLALFLVIVLMLVFFRSIRSIFHLFIPVLFGALFALGIVSLFQDSLSLMALGTSAVVIGIALSYSIHVVTHARYVSDPIELLHDIAQPLTLGSITTIGAFVALIFAESPLLHDFGLLSSLWLVGTTLFCLLFTPHFMTFANSADDGSEILLRMVRWCEKLHWGSAKGVWVLLVLTGVCLFLFQRVKFSSNMMGWNYQPQHVSEAQRLLESIEGDSESSIYLSTLGATPDQTILRYRALRACVDSLVSEKQLLDYHDITPFLFTREEQDRALKQWEHFWSTDARALTTLDRIDNEANLLGFSSAARKNLGSVLRADYHPVDYLRDDLFKGTLLEDWMHRDTLAGVLVLMSRMEIDSAYKSAVYPILQRLSGVSVIDREFFLSAVVESIHHDFNWLLLISSLIVFIALLISYRRLELTLLAFLPMAMSWVIILGLMFLFGMEFNIVNIILSTLIFGIGDDYSIFVVDGLLREYRDGSRLLPKHMSAIFLSALTTVIGIGVLIFAQHPAIRSIAFSAGLGIVVVVLISFILTPYLFYWLVSRPVRVGGWPFTWLSILHLGLILFVFSLGFLMVFGYGLLLVFVPMEKHRRRELFRKFVILSFRFLFLLCPLRVSLGERMASLRHRPPTMYIANHQSYLDIPFLLCHLGPVIIVTNRRLANSPLRLILDWLNFPSVDLGYDRLEILLRDGVAHGYSVLIFPEGTRSDDLRIRRFHHGAFYLAERLHLSITPLIIWGTGHALSKRQTLLMRPARVYIDCLESPSFAHDVSRLGFADLSKLWRGWYQERYRELSWKLASTQDPYYRHLITRSFAYHGIEVERAISLEVKREGYYSFWHEHLPMHGIITCIDSSFSALPLMLAALSQERRIISVQSSAEAAQVSQRAFGASGRVEILYGDAFNASIPPSNVILLRHIPSGYDAGMICDLLEYLFTHLLSGGLLILCESYSPNLQLRGNGMNMEFDLQSLARRCSLREQKSLAHPITGEIIRFYCSCRDSAENVIVV